MNDGEGVGALRAHPFFILSDQEREYEISLILYADFVSLSRNDHWLRETSRAYPAITGSPTNNMAPARRACDIRRLAPDPGC